MAPAPPADADRVRTLLTAGNTVQRTADLTGWRRPRVVAVINTSMKGWLFDHEKDIAYRPDGDPEPAETDPARPGTPVAQLHQAPVEELLRRATDVDDKAVQRELVKAVEGVARLRRAVHVAETRRAAAADVERLERELAEAKARLKGATGRATAPSSAPAAAAPAGVDNGGGTAPEIRAWARTHGVDCNTKGVIPSEVREKYNAHHGINP